MKASSIIFLGFVVGTLGGVRVTGAEGAPDIIWEAPTPSGLANSIQGVGWSPAGTQIAFGSTDRWLRTRNAQGGATSYSILQPHRSGGANQTIYSTDGAFIAVHNTSGGLAYRVHQAVDGLFLGTLTVSLATNGIVRFAPDTQLLTAVGGDGTLSSWPVAEFTVSITVGSGYDRTNTTFNFSTDGTLQSAATQGAITIRLRSDGAVVRSFAGGAIQGSTPLVFSPDSTRIAAWNPTLGKTTLWRISDGAMLMEFSGDAGEGVGAIRFTPGGDHLATTGYLPFVDSAGLWQQRGIIRFWRVADGALVRLFDTQTGIGVTSPVAWSPDAARFAFGTYEGAAVVARVPAEVQGSIIMQRWQGENSSLEISGNGDVRLTQLGVPGADYHVEVTTNSVAWREVGVTRANADGVFQFFDTNGHGCALRLYRAWRAP